MNGNDMVLDRSEVLAILQNVEVDFIPGSNRFWLRVPLQLKRSMIERAGFEPTALLQLGITVFIRFEATAAFERVLGGLYLAHPDHYYLEMSDDGRLFRRYQQIIGSRQCGEVDEQMREVLVERVATILGPLLRAEMAKKGHASPSIAARRTLQEELALLSATTGQVHLPKEHLLHYTRIKQLLENAGGSYDSKGYFSFESGNDAHAALTRLQGGEKINIQQQTQSFYTPPGLAHDVCRQVLPDQDVDLGSKPLAGRRYLEPEAGEGALADILRQWGADEVVCVENFAVAVGKLRAKGHLVHERDFLQLSPEVLGLFDGICANPPFARDADIRHCQHMLRFLKPGGVLSVVMSKRWLESAQRSHVAFRALLQQYEVEYVPIPGGTFHASGTDVATVRLVIRNGRGVVEAPGTQLDLLAA